MKFEVHFSKYVNEKFDDYWKFETVEADTEEDAMKKIRENNEGKVNYILSCTPLKCDYCNEEDIGNNKEDDFSGMDGIMYEEKYNKYSLVIEHYRGERSKVEINYCPKCGRNLRAR